MATPQLEISLDQWIAYCENLSPIQNFLLIGLLSKSRFTSLSILQAQPLETEDNWKAAEEWALKNLRKGLKIYCDNYKKYQAEIGLELGKSSMDIVKEWVKNAAPTIAIAVGGAKGVGVAFLFWLLKYALGKWCEKYTDKKYSGEGQYSRAIPPSTFGAFFDITYTPPIIEYVDDEKAYPLSIPKKQITVPAETIGLIRVANKQEVDDIYFSLAQDKNHSFNFKDAKSNSLVSGKVAYVIPKPEVSANVLDLVAEDLEGVINFSALFSMVCLCTLPP